MSDSARFRGSNAELCEFLERKNAELGAKLDRCRAALERIEIRMARSFVDQIYVGHQYTVADIRREIREALGDDC